MRTRFAPSPTGYLHIGGVRTALFNWLLARRHKGQFILRIDDTDTERNRPEALQPILDGFRWLGIDWDEGPGIGHNGPYFQSERLDIYRSNAIKLLELGLVYPDTKSREEIDSLRKEAEAKKKPYVHRGPEREWSVDRCVESYKTNPTALRLKIQDGKTVVINDLIRGKVEVKTDTIADAVIMRKDGVALYNFATVIDDAAFKITHVVRATEHLANTPVQVLLYEALELPKPEFAHIPVVNAPDSNKKLSKRDMTKFMTNDVINKLRNVLPELSNEEATQFNPAMVSFYQILGYTPESVVNYLGRLGWSLDGETEIMSVSKMIDNFSLMRVNDSPARFDPNKFFWVASEYMKAMPIEQKIDGVSPFLQRAGLPIDREHIKRVLEAYGDRIKLYSDILAARPFFVEMPVYNEKSVEKRIKDKKMLAQFCEVLAGLEFNHESLESALREFAGDKFTPMVHALRVATTGMEIGPSVFDCLLLLGKKETLKRIAFAITLVK